MDVEYIMPLELHKQIAQAAFEKRGFTYVEIGIRSLGRSTQALVKRFLICYRSRDEVYATRCQQGVKRGE